MTYQLTREDFDYVDRMEAKAKKAAQANKSYRLTREDFDYVDKMEAEAVARKNPRPYTGGLTAQETKDFAQAALAGIIKSGQNTGEALAKVLRAAHVPIPEQGKSLGAVKSQETIDNLYYPEGSDIAKVGYEGAQIAPYLALPTGKGGVIRKAATALGQGEALSPVFNPDKSLSDSLIEGLKPSSLAAGVELAFGLPRGIGKVLGMGGRASPEAFERNVAAAGDKPIGIGALSGSPFVNWVEQAGLNNIPFSGHAGKSTEVGEKLDNEIGSFLKDLKQVPKDKDRLRYNSETKQFDAVLSKTSAQKISENLKDNFHENEKIKRDLYGKRNDIAEELNAQVEPRNLKYHALSELNEIKEELNRKGITNISRETVRDLKAAGLSSYDKNGNSLNQNIPFRKINFEKESYQEKAAIARREGRRNDARIYQRLSNALESDLKNSIERIGSDDLKHAQHIADSHYEEKIAPILEDDKLYTHAIGTANKDNIIQDFLTNSSYDNPTRLNSVLRNLSPKHQKQFAYEYLTKGLKHIGTPEEVTNNPGYSDSILTTYSKLKPETKRLLLSPHHINQFDKAFKARKLMGGTIDQMLNPKTGYTHGKLASALTGTTALGSALLGMGLPIIPAYAGGLAATSLLGRGASKYSTSKLAKDAYRYSLKMKNDKRAPGLNTAVILQALMSKNDILSRLKEDKNE